MNAQSNFQYLLEFMPATSKQKDASANQANNWQLEWVGMPEFEQKDLSPKITIKVHFTCQKDLHAFEQLVGQKINNYKVIWFPKAEKRKFSDKRYIDES